MLHINTKADSNNPNSIMEVGYVLKNNATPSAMGERYLAEIKRYLGIRE